MVIEIDPTVDLACKMLLGNQDFPELTIHFLNAVLRLESPIVAVEIVNPFIPQEFDTDKLSILDILAIDDVDRRLNIEIQRTNPGWLAKRLTYYAAAQLVDQISEGDSYRKLQPSIGICILNANAFPPDVPYHNEFRLRTRSGLELTNCLEIHLLELPKYSDRDDNQQMTNPLDQWMYFFRFAKGSTRDELLKRLADPIFEIAIGILDMISRTPQQRLHYNARLKWELDENSRIQAALEEGAALGAARGKIEGEIRLIRTLEELLGMESSSDSQLEDNTLEELQSYSAELQSKIKSRTK